MSGLILAGFGCAGLAQAPGASAALYFKGKTVNVVCPSSPGGGTDLWARFMARHLSRFLPGEPTVIVRNMPAGGGMVAMNQLQRTTARDGLTAVASSTGEPIASILRTEGVDFDITQFTFLTSVSGGTMFYTGRGVISQPEDIVKPKKPLRYGASDTISATNIPFLIAVELLGIPLEKATWGYSGGERRAALLSGELTFASDAALTWAEQNTSFYKDGSMVPAFQSGMIIGGKLVKDPTITVPPDVPTVAELYERLNGKPPSGQVWDVYMSFTKVISPARKVTMLPPNTPDNIANLWKQAIERMAKDPLADSEAKRLLGSSLEFGSDAEKQFSDGLKIPPEHVQWLKNLYTQKYGVVFK